MKMYCDFKDVCVRINLFISNNTLKQEIHLDVTERFTDPGIPYLK
jgi:hypothetical protein